MSHKEDPELKLSPAADEAMAKLVELFLIRALHPRRISAAASTGQRNLKSCSSQSSMSGSATIQIVNINVG